MNKLFEIAKTGIALALLGGCVMAGMKAIDWAIPSPERVVKVIVAPSTEKIRI